MATAMRFHRQEWNRKEHARETLAETSEGLHLMNDDNPILRIIGGKVYIFGSPWSADALLSQREGSAGRHHPHHRAEETRTKAPSPGSLRIALACPVSMKWDKEHYDRICATITKVIESIGIYTLHACPTKEAALVCNRAIRSLVQVTARLLEEGQTRHFHFAAI